MSRGFTLLEIVVALLLLELAVASALGTLSVASRQLAEAERMERAVTEAEGILDSLTGVVGAEGGSRDVPGGAIEWTVDASGVVALRITRGEGRAWLEVRSALTRP